MSRILSSYEKQELIKLSATFTNKKIAAHFGICEETVKRILTRLRAIGIETPPRGTGIGRYKAKVEL